MCCKVAKMLYQDEDEICRLKSCKALIHSEEGQQYIDDFIKSDDDRIKVLAVSSEHITEKQLFYSLDSSSNSIREMALSQLKKRENDLDENKLLQLFEDKVNCKYLVSFAVQNGKTTLINIAKEIDATTRKELVKVLIEKCKSTDDYRIKLLLNHGCNTIVGRWLQGRTDPESDSLRWTIIENNDVDEIERSRLLERLIGRCNEPEIIANAKKLYAATSSELLKVTAHNLSTAGDSRQL